MDDEEQRLSNVYERYRHSLRRARSWSATNPGNLLIRDEVTAAVLERAGDLTRGRILDIGCGSGWWLRSFAGSGIAPERLHGADLLVPRLAVARRTLPAADLRHADARKLPWPAEWFRLVTLFLVLSSQVSKESQLASLREALRVLEPGGDLIVWEPRVANPANRATRLVRRSTFREALGRDVVIHPVTVLPPLARRLGNYPAVYRRFARAGLLSTHRLVQVRKPGPPSSQ